MGAIQARGCFIDRKGMNPREGETLITASIQPRHKSVSLEVQLYHNCIVDEWDQFVADSIQGHYEQTSRWGMVRQAYGWQPTVIEVREKGTLVGGVMILVLKHRLAGSIGYVARGPLAKDGDPIYPAAVAEALHTFANTARLNYLVILPPFHTGTRWAETFREKGFFVKPRDLPPAGVGLVTATLVIDLEQSLESILAGMKRDTRYNIRKACREGFALRKGSYDDIPLFWELMVALCRRRGVSPVPKRRDFFETIWRCFADKDAVQLFICEYSGRPVAALFGISFGNAFRVWKVGWNGEHKNKQPNHFLWWEAIKWAKAKGLKVFDFVWIIQEHAEALLEGREVCGKYAGVTAFKLGFGGKLLLAPEPLYTSFNPTLRKALNVGGHRLLAYPPVAGAFRKLTDRFGGL